MSGKVTVATDLVGNGHVEFLRSYGAAWSAPDDSSLREMITEDAVYVEGGMKTEHNGADAVMSFFRFMLAFAEDSRVVYTSFVGDESGFAAEWIWSGHAQGSLRVGNDLLPATGRPFAVEGVAVCKVSKDGLVSYHKDYYNVGDLLTQLGLQAG